ncbi:MAG: D-arabinono-1,4-lactone oxidase [Alyxoria varia]|nr:MAG: D-arabinono-1,4-lactone oxidase [Alyxoria varia]
MSDPSLQAQRNYHHSTWAGTYHSWPRSYIQPTSVAQVEEVVAAARKRRRRVVVAGPCAHSPSDLTCTSSWLLNLDKLNRILNVYQDEKTGEHRAHVEAGVSLADLNERLAAPPHQLTMPNIGSINQQSIAGALGTATHGSSLRHGNMCENVRSLRIVLGDGSSVWCSRQERPDLFRAALVSLGAIGIIVEVVYRMVSATNVEYFTSVIPLQQALDDWDGQLWKQAEFVRCWWMPYSQRMIVWKADKTAKPLRKPKASWVGGGLGFHMYQSLLWFSNHVPSILPFVEWFVFGMQNGFSYGHIMDGVEEQHQGLLMDCLYSQFVNEWAIPIEKGPEAILRLSQWLNGEEKKSGIPFSSKGLYIHCPTEVRIADNSKAHRGYLDPTNPDGPTLYLNATLYRAYGADPVCRERYYEAFEWLMKSLGGRPHWAKNFTTLTKDDVNRMYGKSLTDFRNIRQQVDPDGVFVGPWHRRLVLEDSATPLAAEEVGVSATPRKAGGTAWYGAQGNPSSPIQDDRSVKGGKSEESFDSFGASTSTGSGEEILRSEATSVDFRS